MEKSHCKYDFGHIHLNCIMVTVDLGALNFNSFSSYILGIFISIL